MFEDIKEFIICYVGLLQIVNKFIEINEKGIIIDSAILKGIKENVAVIEDDLKLYVELLYE